MRVTLAEAIYQASRTLAANGITNARLDAEVLLSNALNKDRAWLLAHGCDALDIGYSKLFEEAVARRARREPLQYIVSRQEFWGLEFVITPDVLIPRPETELVVETAIEAIRNMKQSPLIVDLCTGSGCIAISLATENKECRIFAGDKSVHALNIARENSRKHAVSDRIRFLEGNLFEPFEELYIRGHVDVITANPPYISSGDFPVLQNEVRDYEPEIALIAGPEGTEILREIVETAPDFLKAGGILIMEMGMGQAGTIAGLVKRTGAYHSPEILKDLAGIDRVIMARKR